jgi:hypothetical protein
MDYNLLSSDNLTMQVKNLGINTWSELVKYVQDLPYGRNNNREDLGLVLSEKKGTCSSKHAFLKQISILNKVPNIKLILSIYKMTQENTPNIGEKLSENNINYIPEAHCYLIANNERLDLTTNTSQFQKIKKDILIEQEILPNQVDKFKVEYHKNYLKNWIIDKKIDFNFEEIWNIREKCISNLTSKKYDKNRK